MVTVALDVVEACWLDECEKQGLRGRIVEHVALLGLDVSSEEDRSAEGTSAHFNSAS
jgi:hypothetical protein